MHKHHDSPGKERGPEEALGGPECLLGKSEVCLSGELHHLVIVAGLTHAQWTDAQPRADALPAPATPIALVLLKAPEMRDKFGDLTGGS